MENEILESIANHLGFKLDEKTFCTSMITSAETLKLSVNNVGVLEFPLAPKVVKKLTKIATPALFGWKEQTIYDPAVRDVWEISKNEVQFLDSRWEQTLKSVLDKIHRNLKVSETDQLSAELHNLLIYERGQFFAPHQDSEKENGMIATLVVLLPSDFRGGELIINQGGNTKPFSPPRKSEDKIMFIAFYSDCVHEVTKVTSGCRIALTYNIIAKKIKNQNKKPTLNELLTKDLEKYFNASSTNEYPSDTRCFVHLLDHQYTEASFAWTALKGTDHTRVNLLLSAAKRLNLEAYLTLAEIHETWEANSSGDDYYGYWNNHDDDDDDDISDHENTEDISVGEKLNEECVLRRWIDEKNKLIEQGQRYISEDMISWTTATDKFIPIKTEYEGFMGNYGNTADRWYHRAALVLWPRKNHFENLFLVSSSYVLKMINKLIIEDRDSGIKALKEILPQWSQYDITESEKALTAFRLSATLNEPKLAQNIVDKIYLSALTQQSWKGFLELFEIYGEAWCLTQLEKWAQNNHYAFDKTIKNIDDFVSLSKPLSKKIALWFLEYQLEVILDLDKSRQKQGRREIIHNLHTHLNLIQKLIFAAKGFASIYKAMLQQIINFPEIYPPIEIGLLITNFANEKEIKTSHEFKQLVLQTKKRLTDIISNPKQLGDWAIKVHQSCKCKLCNQLHHFLESNTQYLVWPLAKEGRQHIHSAIDEMMLPITHITKREGSPYKLTLAKKKELFEQDWSAPVVSTTYIERF